MGMSIMSPRQQVGSYRSSIARATVLGQTGRLSQCETDVQTHADAHDR
jgi:hypothetical protein